METESTRDRPPIEPMTSTEVLEGICTLIKLLNLEWKKFETFHWMTSQTIQNKYYLKSHIDSLYMGMYNMLMEKEHQQGKTTNWMK